ncbi:phosphatidate cytidylyltransferase [Vulcanisaeta thermophila]|uniref:phosphatidate cytidylyltransferase n=1 Tax=Vulcanisaeta thermophila TaxID=867917 RepID=UPI0008537C80|nr:phosphatidate cytidylyltransferase [Vulcanisaeta thermophila]
MNRLEKLKAIALRKLIHVVLSVFLIIPYIANLSLIGLTTQLYFTILMVSVAFIYVIQVKRPIITAMIMDVLVSARRTILQQIMKTSPNLMSSFEALDEGLLRLERTMRELLDVVERDYERRGGYLGILMGIVGVLASNLIAGDYVFYGIISLIVYDTMSALGGTLLGRVNLPFSNATMEGMLVGMASLFIILFPLTGNLISSLAITVAAALAEAYGIEDNLTIPIVTSLMALVLKTPIIP